MIQNAEHPRERNYYTSKMQAQMLAASLSDNSTIAAKFINAFWLAGIFLDVLGAVASDYYDAMAGTT